MSVCSTEIESEAIEALLPAAGGGAATWPARLPPGPAR